MHRTKYKFGNFLASVEEFVGISEFLDKDDKENLTVDTLTECVRYSFKIQDLSHGDFLGTKLWAKHGRKYPIRFKTKEEAYDALHFIIELYQRITGDTKIDVLITGKTTFKDTSSDGTRYDFAKEDNVAFTFNEDCVRTDSFFVNNKYYDDNLQS